MANLILNGSTSGSITLAAPAVANTTTLTLPTTSGTVLTSGANTNFPAGSVLQVVNTTYATVTSTSSSSYTDTGITLNITPSSSSNKVLILVNISGLFSSSATVGQFAISDGSNNLLLEFEGLTAYSLSSGTSYGEVGTNYLHSPATTSSFTYKIRFKNVAGTGISINQKTSGVSTSTITLIEVKG